MNGWIRPIREPTGRGDGARSLRRRSLPIAHEELDARRIGSSRSIRIDRDSLLQLGRYRSWAMS
jgi:hypothetical protein